ncbi:DUF2127 domain-containing protein [Arenimonas sp. GDDSR-1]|uniref:DUF2127 domain-containing protein n=1 Tax=Arenimonas sp. GDDSR-1 TaxID=2950125 RepID=UPI002612092C|nr:DUF2127 domain-containing protein [Arenimonas sp. GDDSR-1]
MAAAHTGVRWIAALEATKGLLATATGLWLLSLFQYTPRVLATLLVERLHLNPASHYPDLFVANVSTLSDRNITMLGLAALVYAALRFIEAMGLWQNRAWAKWFAAVTGAIYIPFEIYELLQGYNSFVIIALLINILVVAYLARALRAERT